MTARVAAQVGDRLTEVLLTELDRHVTTTLFPELKSWLSAELKRAVVENEEVRQALADWLSAELKRAVVENEEVQQALANTKKRPSSALADLFLTSELYVPNPYIVNSLPGEYMAASIPMARDFLDIRYVEFLRDCGAPYGIHRKAWEHAFIYEHLRRAGVLQMGKRGLGFGIGREVLPALFARAGAHITATDLPPSEGGWPEHYAGTKDQLFVARIIDRAAFDERVHVEPCDMRAIPEHLKGYDFCWSSCCFEHLGDLQSGLDFVLNSVECTLAVGGIAVHTTEFNLSSDDVTIDTGIAVYYRKQDLLRLCRLLEERGHHVESLRIPSGNLPLDYLVDTPPFRPEAHVKLRREDFVITSIGLVVRRGR